MCTSLNNADLPVSRKIRSRNPLPTILGYQQATVRETHPDVAASLNNLAGLYQDQGRYNEAEPLYQQSLAIRKQQLGKNHPSVAQSLYNLAFLYYFQEDTMKLNPHQQS